MALAFVFKDTEASIKAWITRRRNSPGFLSGYYRKYADDYITEAALLSELTPEQRGDVRAKQLRAMGQPPSWYQYSVNGDGTGGWTKERKKLHAEIFREVFSPDAVKAATPKEGEAPTLYVLGGRGGSGKGAFTNGTIKEFDSSKAITLDSDAIKDRLRPPYRGWNASTVHEESAQLFQAMMDHAKSLGLNVVHDVTLSSGKHADTIRKHVEAGYRVEGHYMFVPPQTSARRALSRYFNGKGRGRLVPVSVLLSMKDNEKNFEAMLSLFDKWSAYDNQGSSPKLISRGSR
jgi:predicted ABC-type ATPase